MKEDEARELAKRFGVRMCDENGDTHGEELYCLGLEDIIEMAKALAQPELCKYGQEPKSCTSSPMDCQCAIDATFAQPEQEPDDGYCKACDGWKCTAKAGCVAFSNPPPQRTWVGLTDEEIKEIIGPWGPTPIKGYTRDLFDKIEAKLKEKNT